jgi:hypothetical protein
VSDLDVLRELVGQVRPPAYDDLVAVARKRRRRSVAGGVAGVAVVVVAVGMAAAGLSDGRRAQEPTPLPSPTATASGPTAEGEWAPERIRAEGAPVDGLGLEGGAAPPALDAQVYCVSGEACDNWYYPDFEGKTVHWALEVAQEGRSALFDVRGKPWLAYFDDDSILVQDGLDQEVRFRLLRADGTAVQLRRLSDPAPAATGPDVVLIYPLDSYRRGNFGPEGPGVMPYLVDAAAGTIQQLDVPQEVEWWGPNVEEFLWGGDDCRVIWQRPDGGFDHHDLECRDRAQSPPTDPGWNWAGFDEWAEPGRMAVVEHNNDGIPLVVHVSLDGGATWERIEIEPRDWDGTSAQAADALADALAELG